MSTNPATLPGMADEVAYQLVQAVLLTASTVLKESERLFRPLDLTAAQFNVLSALAAHGGDGLSQRELSDVLVVDRSNVTGLLDRLERQGWVVRRADAKDRRIYRVGLTTGGRAVWRRASKAYAAALVRATEGLAAAEMSQVVHTLGNVQKQATRWRDPAQP